MWVWAGNQLGCSGEIDVVSVGYVGRSIGIWVDMDVGGCWMGGKCVISICRLSGCYGSSGLILGGGTK